MRNFDELLNREDLKGRVTLLTEMRDTMGFMLKVVGADPANFNDAEWDKAIELLDDAHADAARSGRSPATSTSATSPPGNIAPARPGPVT